MLHLIIKHYEFVMSRYIMKHCELVMMLPFMMKHYECVTLHSTMKQYEDIMKLTSR